MTGSDAWPDLAGRLTDFGHVLPVRVYFEDTDFSGLVYHASYLRFMERGRSDFLRLRGIGHEALARGEYGAGPLAFAVRRLSVDFEKPARIDDVLTVETRVREITGATINLAQRVVLAALALVSADVAIVLVNNAARPQRIPRDVRERLDGRTPG
jgi:acyl-CoA thioester hydrolase